MSRSKTAMIVVMLFCVLCFAFVAFYFLVINKSAVAEKPDDKETAILKVAGLYESGKSEREVQSLYQARITPVTVDLDSGKNVPRASDKCVTLARSDDPAEIRKRCATEEIFIVQDAQHRIEQVIVPIKGQGAKGMMQGLVALEPDGRTVKSIRYYDLKETPELGGKVQEEAWTRQWVGKKLVDDEGKPVFKVLPPSQAQDAHSVDGITGATMTSNGVQNSVNYWMGERGFGPFLARLRNGELSSLN